jgi:hypothetical protein
VQQPAQVDVEHPAPRVGVAAFERSAVHDARVGDDEVDPAESGPRGDRGGVGEVGGDRQGRDHAGGDEFGGRGAEPVGAAAE